MEVVKFTKLEGGTDAGDDRCRNHVARRQEGHRRQRPAPDGDAYAPHFSTRRRAHQVDAHFTLRPARTLTLAATCNTPASTSAPRMK
jgi:hypothetical protein